MEGVAIRTKKWRGHELEQPGWLNTQRLVLKAVAVHQ